MEISVNKKMRVASLVQTRLRPDEWNSGDRLWLMELCAPFATEENKLTEAMVADLMQNVFTGKSFKMHVTDPLTGKREVKEIGE